MGKILFSNKVFEISVNGSKTFLCATGL